MLICRYNPNTVETVVTIGGTWRGNTQSVIGSFLQHVVIRSLTPATTFSASIVDKNNVTVRSWTLATGVINDLTPTPAEGVYTVNITGASADEAFSVYLAFVEAY